MRDTIILCTVITILIISALWVSSRRIYSQYLYPYVYEYRWEKIRKSLIKNYENNKNKFQDFQDFSESFNDFGPIEWERIAGEDFITFHIIDSTPEKTDLDSFKDISHIFINRSTESGEYSFIQDIEICPDNKIILSHKNQLLKDTISNWNVNYCGKLEDPLTIKLLKYKDIKQEDIHLLIENLQKINAKSYYKKDKIAHIMFYGQPFLNYSYILIDRDTTVDYTTLQLGKNIYYQFYDSGIICF